MILERLKLVNFRNYQQADVNFRPGTNVLFGKNGQGKTNILESIYYLALTKSFRSSYDQNLVSYNQNFFRIQGDFKTSQGRNHRSSLAYSSTEGKRLIYNGQRIQKFADYIGRIPIVLLAPSDLQISQSGPHQRRQFLDIMLSQASQLYLHHLLEYRRSLRQRNTVLQSDSTNMNLLQSWEKALMKHGSPIIQKRLEAVEQLSHVVKEHYRELSGETDNVKIVYQSSVSLKAKENIETAYEKEFEKNREKDLTLETTTLGPHRDDILFLINGKPLRGVGSQGEHKTFVISLKMAEFGFLKNVNQEPPILLFDDIFGELDAGRITNMIRTLSKIGQVFLTTTSANFFEKVNEWEPETCFFGINNGTINFDERVWQKTNQ